MPAVTITHLEMTDPAHLRGREADDPAFEVREAIEPSPELQRFFYTAVGGGYFWTDRLGWPRARWLAACGRWRTFVAYLRGTPAGYYNLERMGEDRVEIVYFGLLPGFHGRGLGAALLTDAARRAWALGARRVTVNTCSLDAPGALPNYLARGFRVEREETIEKALPERPPGFWPEPAPGSRPDGA